MNILKTETQARAGIDLFYQNIKSTETNYEDFLKELNLLNSYFQEFAAKKNNRVNKSATTFQMYFKNEIKKKRNIETIEKRGQLKLLSAKQSYRDYKQEYLILRKRKYSYQAIANYSTQHFKVKVSKDSVKNLIKEFE
jgi:hypothetical protein